jgi:hypothetical protein
MSTTDAPPVVVPDRPRFALLGRVVGGVCLLGALQFVVYTLTGAGAGWLLPALGFGAAGTWLAFGRAGVDVAADRRTVSRWWAVGPWRRGQAFEVGAADAVVIDYLERRVGALNGARVARYPVSLVGARAHLLGVPGDHADAWRLATEVARALRLTLEDRATRPSAEVAPDALDSAPPSTAETVGEAPAGVGTTTDPDAPGAVTFTLPGLGWTGRTMAAAGSLVLLFGVCLVPAGVAQLLADDRTLGDDLTWIWLACALLGVALVGVGGIPLWMLLLRRERVRVGPGGVALHRPGRPPRAIPSDGLVELRPILASTPWLPLALRVLASEVVLARGRDGTALVFGAGLDDDGRSWLVRVLRARMAPTQD